jgi:aminoglycoside phosphotransferase (APT) family kinase protein
MTKYYAKWTVNPLEIPKSPEERMKLWQSMLEMTKADMKAGIVKEWGMTSDLSEGFTINEFANETEAAAYTLRWIPALNVVAKPFLTVDQSLEILKKAMASMKK